MSNPGGLISNQITLTCTKHYRHIMGYKYMWFSWLTEVSASNTAQQRQNAVSAYL